MMKVLVVGSGGREHALAWKISQSSLVGQVFVCPGNPGIALEAGIECVAIQATEQKKIAEFCHTNKIDFVVVGPDQALADGLVDALAKENILAFGPTAAAAQIESSKAFSKALMKRVGIPTAGFEVFSSAAEAHSFVEKSSWSGWVVKADGLALGKGVVVCDDKESAKKVISEFLDGKAHGDAGSKIIVEEKLVGPEVSAFHFCDGKDSRFLGFACDHKQLLDGGKGPNTGGMGTYSPADWVAVGLENEISQTVVAPLLKEMKSLGHAFSGVLFTGLMITKNGPKVLEFNARFGDPETQSLLPRMADDLLPWLLASAKGELGKCGEVKQSSQTAVHVVMAAHGYPAQVRKGDAIAIDEELLKPLAPVKIFFAGVSPGLRTNGGRVLGVTALASNRKTARALAYENVKKITFEGAQMRRDIGE